jgi:hypothetical protein
VNLYAYVGNDPVNFVDVDGEQRRPIVAPQMGPNAPRTLPEILRAQELRSRVAEINAVSPRLNRYVPTSIGPPAATDVRIATGVSRAANIVRPGIINSNPAASSSGQSAAANLRSVLGQGQFDGVTGKGAFHFTAGGGQNAQSAAMTALGANGASQTSLNFGGGLTATAQAYTATSTQGPSINVTFHQSITPTGSRIPRDVVVSSVKIRY